MEEKAKNQVLEAKLINTAIYEVLVKTGSVKGAGTDARVYLELYGPEYAASVMGSPTLSLQAAATTALSAASGALSSPDGCSGEVRLFTADSAAKPFQRGGLDSFVVTCQDVGLPTGMKVWHDNTGKRPDWFLEYLKVRKKGTRDWIHFACNR